jgi:orotidine-5'-phosphate decarboxylase
MDKSRIVVDLDKMSLETALELTRKLGVQAAAYKAHSLADLEMAATLTSLRAQGAHTIMLDWKLHDMPDTVAQRAAKAKAGGADWLTVHAGGGPKMVRAAVDNGPGFIIAITVLTCLEDPMVEYLYGSETWLVVRKLALWAKEGGAHALVCSAKQVQNIANDPELQGMRLIVPGTRSAGVQHHDQKQVTTPYEAIMNGADYLVGGRQITQAEGPVAAMEAMALEIAPAIEARIAAGTWREG